MPLEFCDHLGEYGVQYVRAEASYRAMLAQFDRVRAGAADDDSLDLLECLVRDWRDEVKLLRKRFVTLAREGRIAVPGGGAEDAADGPRCAECEAVIPRLEFRDFTVAEAGEATYRGQVLPVTVGA
ncbi:MAG: hypothetical protein IH621_06850 [Krumholzibacteria bacterium]|nr:hypothetical protein [Candidatus Krumholzibacteria bacterium]